MLLPERKTRYLLLLGAQGRLWSGRASCLEWEYVTFKGKRPFLSVSPPEWSELDRITLLHHQSRDWAQLCLSSPEAPSPPAREITSQLAEWPLARPAFRTALGEAFAHSPDWRPAACASGPVGTRRASAQVLRALEEACALASTVHPSLLPFCPSSSDGRLEVVGRAAVVPPAPFQNCPGHSFSSSCICMQVWHRAGEGSS